MCKLKTSLSSEGMFARCALPGIRADCHPVLATSNTPTQEALHVLPFASAAAQPHLLPGPSFGTELDLTQAYFASPAKNYLFVSCGFSNLSYSLHVSERVLELGTGAGLGGRALPLHQLGLRKQITTSEQPKPIPPLVSHTLPQQPLGLPMTHFKC